MTKLSKAYRRWLKRLATGKIADREWPIGVDSRGRLRTAMPVMKVVPDLPDHRATGPRVGSNGRQLTPTDRAGKPGPPPTRS